MLLTELCATHPQELFGEHVPAGSTFPLLYKLLDCQDWLSIQVHPNDETARRLLGEEYGKTEAWVVLDAQPGGRIYAGLLPGIGRKELERHLAENSVDQCLNSFIPTAGDCIFLPAGIVHAVGGGVVLAEVQQTSDATFRLFDWNRLASDGRPRSLHLAEALASIDWKAGPVRPVQATRVHERPGVSQDQLVRCPYFHLDRFHLDGPFDVPFAGRLSIWVVVEGEAALQSGSYWRVFRRGETVLVPGSVGEYSWHPVAGHKSTALLGTRLPVPA
jgi:mannose-6-phosphate isomerase